MFWINAISRAQSHDERCFVFESFTIAEIVADKLRREGFDAEILNQDWELIAQIPDDPHRRLMGAWIPQMSARGTAFLQLWLERNILTLSLDRDQAPRLAQKLVQDASDEGLELKDLEIESNSVEDHIADIIVHVGEPGMAGD